MPLSEIDGVLAGAVAAGEVPGVVALAADRKGLLYEGAFGKRDLETGAAMTADAIFRLASMTKALTSTAALQLVEEGRLALDEPIGGVLPELSSPRVLDGVDEEGRPRLRAARRPLTLRHLLTHTAGFAYDFWNRDLKDYLARSGAPSILSRKLAALSQPLLFDPGERWEYGINTDWVGRAVERASGKSLEAAMRERVTGPLGMNDTGFTLSAEALPRLPRVHRRRADGVLEALQSEVSGEPEFFAGGSGLYGSGRDYLLFLQMLLGGGKTAGVEVLRPQTVALLAQNQIGALAAGILRSVRPEISNDVDLFPGRLCKWGLLGLLNAERIPGGRNEGSLTWAGLYNSYYWVDWKGGLAAVILTQILPFADGAALRLYRAFERAVYRAL